jgi:hypothetical protein
MDSSAYASADQAGWRSPSGRPGSMIFANEFAAVRATADTDANGIRLRLTDLRSGQSIWLDAMALEALVWAGAQDRLQSSLDYGIRDARWSVEPGAEAEG